MVTALDQVSDRVRGLEAGADDFLTKPVNDLQLMTRVKSLVRLKMLTDELRLRASTTRNIGIEELAVAPKSRRARRCRRVLLIDERQFLRARVSVCWPRRPCVDVVSDPQARLFQAAEAPYECVIVSTGFSEYDPLRLCSQLRSLDRTRFLPIILLAEEGEDDRLVRGLELGINDYLFRPIDRQELIARLRTQIRRKHYNDHLRASVTQTIEMAVTDGLTGLHNRRYLDSHLKHAVRPCDGAPAAVVAPDHSTSTASRLSTTATAMTAATTCCASSRGGCARTSAASISPAGMAARSSSLSCLTPTRPPLR